MRPSMNLRSPANISHCGTYRYSLYRSVPNPEVRYLLPPLVVCMLNPSTADATSDDATIRRVKGFAYRWGHEGVIVVNLFAFRSTYPNDLYHLTYPTLVGPRNDEVLRQAFDYARDWETRVLLAWGSHGGNLRKSPHSLSRGTEVMKEAIKRTADIPSTLHVLGWTKNHQPRHPVREAYISAEEAHDNFVQHR